MAITSLIPELWAAALYRELRRVNVWLDTVTDVSGEVIVGNKINIGNLTNEPTVRDYVKGTDLMAAEDPDDAEVELLLNQQKYFNILVHDLDEIQTRPNLMADWARKAGAAISEHIDSYVWTQQSTGAIAAGQDVDVASLKDDLTETDANIKAYVEALLKLTKLMDDLNWPVDGRWVNIPTKAKFYILKYLIDRGVIGSGSQNNSALVDAAIQNMFGFRIRVSRAMPNADGAGSFLALGGLNSHLYFAQQVSQVEAYRPENAFADAVKGLFVYGSARMDTTRRVSVTEGA